MSRIQLETFLHTILVLYHNYAIQGKPYNMLSEAELDQMMKEELPNLIEKRSEMSQHLFDGAMEINKRATPLNVLSKAEFAQLMKQGLPNFIQASRKRDAVDSLFKELEQKMSVVLRLEEGINCLARTLVERLRSSSMTPEAATGG